VGFAFAGLHFGDLAFVQQPLPPDQLARRSGACPAPLAAFSRPPGKKNKKTRPPQRGGAFFGSNSSSKGWRCLAGIPPSPASSLKLAVCHAAGRRCWGDLLLQQVDVEPGAESGFKLAGIGIHPGGIWHCSGHLIGFSYHRWTLTFARAGRASWFWPHQRPL